QGTFLIANLDFTFVRSRHECCVSSAHVPSDRSQRVGKGESMRSAIARVGTYGLGIAVLVSLVGARLSAQGVIPVPQAPEIDGASLASGLALASGIVLILRS